MSDGLPTDVTATDAAVQARREARLVGRIAAGAAVAALGALPFLLILALVVSRSRTLDRFDRGVAEALNAWALSRPQAVTVLEILDRVTSPWSFRLAVLFAAALLWRAGSRRLATWAVTTMALGSLLNPLLKEAVQRARPTFPEAVASASNYSFPSGHAQNSMLGVAVLLLIALPLLRRRGKVAAWGLGIVLVVVTGFDRVALGVHYLSDVLAGWIVALALLAGTTVAFEARRRGPAAVHGVEPHSSRRLAPPADDQPAGSQGRGGVPALARELRSLLARLLAATALIWGALVVMGWLVAALDDVWLLAREEPLVRWLEAHRTAGWNDITAAMSWIAGTRRIIISLAVVAVVLRMVFHRWRESAFVVAAVSMQALAFVSTTAVVSRARPAVEHLDSSPPTSSFPSGHAGAALALYGSIALVLVWHTRSRWLRALMWLLLLVPPACVAYSRLYRGMHFPTDIAGSLLNSALCITVAARVILFATLPPQLAEVLDTSFRRRGASIGPEPPAPSPVRRP